MKISIAVLLTLLAGCEAQPQRPMTPEQRALMLDYLRYQAQHPQPGYVVQPMPFPQQHSMLCNTSGTQTYCSGN